MDEAVVKELKNNLEAINNDMKLIINDVDLTEELVKKIYIGIRILVDYSEKIAIEGVDAIEN